MEKAMKMIEEEKAHRRRKISTLDFTQSTSCGVIDSKERLSGLHFPYFGELHQLLDYCGHATAVWI